MLKLSKADTFKYIVLNLLLIMFGVAIFGNILALNKFLTVTFTVVGMEFARYYLLPKVMGITYMMEKVKKL